MEKVPYYTVSPNEQMGDDYFQAFGFHCVPLEPMIQDLTRRLSSGVYDGGMWELRTYFNGAKALVFNDDTRAPIASMNCQGDAATLETISLAANMMIYSFMCQKLYDSGDEVFNQVFHDHYHLLRYALGGHSEICFTDDGRDTRDFTEEELAAISMSRATDDQSWEYSGRKMIAKILD